MPHGTILCPPQIHPEQEDTLNLDKENDQIEESLLSESWSQYLYSEQDTFYMTHGTILCPPQIHPEQVDALNLDFEYV